MVKRMGIVWNLRRLMAERDMFQTTDLIPALAEHGVHLSREQVYRLVAQVPQRLSMDVLAALCSILHVTPADLITVTETHVQVAKPTATGETTAVAKAPPARRVRLTRPGDR
ncbi:Cro/Cl family transcriptional regulator [Streptomyces sp. CB00316]|uniref:helix-turn-helix domain-containing protein n=1 Tax=Streptomycetaceae TaxID=2062 RepID=UPI00093DC2F2|nr:MULTISPECIES: helix-turn-helix transcriptional regulator [Streptomycetaceae]MEC3992110.1 helix-turn-helix transcriptional regulator [Actinacidiphila sp. DG2A-62]MEC3998875.1 helix-turn-helix transcriptional regulator [Actinacidiphila sp. DG2A-62]OKJ10548.1 Cro/Cl family transcriptional regulator [Streptomyces sp. CB00316]